MATAKEKLNPPKQSDDGDSNLALQVRPTIKMGAPNIKIPEIKIPEIKVSAQAIDIRPLVTVLNDLGRTIAQIAATQTQIMQALHNQKEPNVTVNSAPVEVKVPPRPRSFYVELDKDGDETIGMRISAASQH